MKNFVMMMGEFEVDTTVSEIANSSTYLYLFAVFVFIIAMIRINLLTKIVLSKTHDIESNMKLLSLVSRIRLIYKMESTLLQWYMFVTYHIIYFPSINPYRITYSIWIWKSSILLGLRGDINTSVYKNLMVI